uniref:CCHC-type domain-containing protein n=1 Tax=Fagus sylvatica TaxID=28930 RepID=A0A2N9GXF9_FAGSY
MTGEDGKTSGIEKFDGTDFGYWKMQIEDYLYGKKLHLPLLGKKPDKMEDAEWALLDRQVLGVIRLTLSRSVAHNVVKETTTVGLMTALSGMYEKPLANNKVHLMKKLFNLKMAEGAAVAKHLNEFNTITNQLSFVEIEFNDEIRALIILASLPNSWEAMRMAVSNSVGKCKLKYDDIRDLILSEEVRRRDACIDNAEGQAFVTENRGRSRNKWRNDQATFNDRSKSIDKSQHTETRECFHCGKKGHIRINCRHWRKEQTEDKDHKHDDKKGTTAVVVDEEVVVLSVQEQKCEHVDNIDDEWVVDSAATHHVVRTKELFTMYKAGDFSTVKMGNTSYSKIVGIGDVCIKTNVGYTVILKNVRHVPDLCFNLISTPVMDRAGYCNHLGNGRWKLAKGPMVVARGRICCGLYRTRVKGLVKFSLPENATDEGVTCDDDEVKDSKNLEQGERAPALEMVEPYEKRSARECRKDNFKNIWSSDEGEPENWIKDIQGEINSLRMKGIDIDMVLGIRFFYSQQESLESSVQNLIKSWYRRQKWQLFFNPTQQDLNRAKWRTQLAKFLESTSVRVIAIFLLLLDLIFTILELSSSLLSCTPKTNKIQKVWYHWAGIAILSMLSGRIVALAVGLGSSFFRRPGYVLDRVVESAFELSDEAIEAQIEAIVSQFEALREENRRLLETIAEKDKMIEKLKEEVDQCRHACNGSSTYQHIVE